jgi:hypothetical protein
MLGKSGSNNKKKNQFSTIVHLKNTEDPKDLNKPIFNLKPSFNQSKNKIIETWYTYFNKIKDKKYLKWYFSCKIKTINIDIVLLYCQKVVKWKLRNWKTSKLKFWIKIKNLRTQGIKKKCAETLGTKFENKSHEQ